MILINNKIGSFYVIFILISLLVGMIYMYINLKKINSNKNVYLYLIMFLTFSLFFGKILGHISDIDNSSLLTSGLSSYGGLIGIILASIIFELIVPLNKRLIKLSIIVLPLMYSIGKIGCLLEGCCHGIEYSSFMSIKYIDNNVSYFPIQLVESIVFLILFIFLNKFKNNKNITYIALLVCSLSKFLLDFLRYEHNLFSITNIISIIIILVSIVLLFRRKTMSKT